MKPLYLSEASPVMNPDASAVASDATEFAEREKPFPVVGIGASAGGIEALQRFFRKMPADSGMAFVVILHLSPEHESNLAALLQSRTLMPVTQVTESIKVQPDHVYVIPPAKHLILSDGSIQLTDRERDRTRIAPVDLFFRTLAETYGKDGVCIVLSGTGADGTIGLKRVKEHGGTAFVQDPNDAEYQGMPRSAIDTGLADLVLPVTDMPEKLVSFRERAAKIQLPEEEERPDQQASADALREVLSLLRVRTGHDFSNYKSSTLLRRIARRLQVCELEDLPAYVGFLRERPGEVQALLRDLLISVTNFFRDPEAFKALEQAVLPKLFEGKRPADQVRAWVVGCATGEESYSLAMLLAEYAGSMHTPPGIQVFASDIDQDALGESRDCRYHETIAADVSAERLQRFFVKDGNRYRVNKELRELVLFAEHNILRDPPFSRLDLISCRNLLIYLNRDVQDRVLETFHFALRPDGFLFLGSSESAESLPALFAPVDKKHRLYTRRAVAGRPAVPPPMALPAGWQAKRHSRLDTAERNLSFGELHHQVVEHYAPPSVLVNEEHDILHASAHAGRYLRFAAGEPSRNLLKVVHPDLRLELRGALFLAAKEGGVQQSRPVTAQIEGQTSYVKMRVRKLEGPESARGFLLLFFEESRSPEPAADGQTGSGNVPANGKDVLEPVMRQLEDELRGTRDQLRSTIEQYETSTEELRASNEELQAINEELRSASEELETSKEELQSINEELSTVNHELKEKVDELTRANSDLFNLMASTEIGTIFLDRALQIKLYTPRAQELFNIIPSDLGRPLEHLTHKLLYGRLSEDARIVLHNAQPLERAVQDASGGSYIARLRPYRTAEDRIDGVVLTFIDVSELKQAEQALKEVDRRKDEFLATLSHELRNPLAPIRTALEILQRAPADGPALNRACGVLERQVGQLVRIVDDLLEMSRITQGKIELRKERVLLADLFEIAIEGNRPFIEKANHELVVQLPPEPVYLEVDATRLAQVLGNLLNNAAKYTPPGGRIAVSAEVEDAKSSQTGAARLVIRVRDNGIGIAPEFLPHVFDLFVQVEKAREHSRGGLGIGLTLVRQLVELHGGSVEAASAGPGQGSEFIVRLPLAAEQSPDAPSTKPAGPTRSVSRRRILVVDDNRDAADSLTELLRLMGHEVWTAYDGPSAVQVAAEHPPQMALLDIGLPGLDGYEVGRRIRRQAGGEQAVLIALTGWGQEEDRQRSREAGFNHHLVKPIHLGALQQMVD